jgi:hypothetical protein
MNQTNHTYKVTVIVKGQDYRKSFTIQAERDGLAKTRAIKQATDEGLHLSGDFVEYEVAQI